MRHNTHKERLDLWQDSMRMARYRQPASIDWYAVTGWLILLVSALLTGWVVAKGIPLLVHLLVAAVD